MPWLKREAFTTERTSVIYMCMPMSTLNASTSMRNGEHMSCAIVPAVLHPYEQSRIFRFIANTEHSTKQVPLNSAQSRRLVLSACRRRGTQVGVSPTIEVKSVPSISVSYARNGSSTKANALGMRPMQERAYEKRGEQYLLIKSPPASGKSRALMFIALDKLQNQGLKQAIIVVPEKAIGASFHDEPLTEVRLLGRLARGAEMEPLQRARRRQRRKGQGRWGVS